MVVFVAGMEGQIEVQFWRGQVDAICCAPVIEAFGYCFDEGFAVVFFMNVEYGDFPFKGGVAVREMV